MLAGLITNVELLMLALDVLVEAEQLVLLTGAGVVLLVVVVLPLHLSTTPVVLLPRAHPMFASVILHLLLAQLAWTLTVVILMQPKSYCPLTRESTEQQTGMLDH